MQLFREEDRPLKPFQMEFLMIVFDLSNNLLVGRSKLIPEEEKERKALFSVRVSWELELFTSRSALGGLIKEW